MGILADRFGRKTILVPSLLIFGLAGFLCAFQDSYENLLLMRFIQGIGAASLGSLNVTIIGDLFKDQERIRVMGYNASALSIGTASFPALGGMLASFNWHYVFFLPGLVLPLAFLVLWKLQTPASKNSASLKIYLGNVWKIMNQKSVWGLFLVNIMVFTILYGAYLSFFPLLMEARFQANALIIGFFMSIMSLITAFFSSQLVWARKKFTTKILLSVSALFYALSLIFMAIAYNWFILTMAIVFFGVGHGFFLPNIQTALVGFAPVSERAAFMSINSMVLRIGQTLGPVVAALFYIQQSLQPVFLLSAGIALLMIIIVWLLVGDIDKP